MDQFLDPETDKKHQFLDPETDVFCQFLFWIQKLTLWISFWVQKLTLWARGTLCLHPPIVDNPTVHRVGKLYNGEIILEGRLDDND